MLDSATIQEWLAKYATNGVTLNIGELIQYRHHINAIDLTPKRPPQARLAGTYVTRLKGRGMEFDESRHYQPGDDIRAIDWRVTARTGKTHTKIFREERERPVYILTDLSASMQFGSQFVFKSVQAAHLSALIAWSAIARGDKVGGISFNGLTHREDKPRTRQSSVLSQLNGILALQNESIANRHEGNNEKSTFYDSCLRLSRLVKPGSLVWILSDFRQLDSKSASVLADIQRHCEVCACLINDPMEIALPSAAHREALNVTDGQAIQTLVLGDSKTSQDYATWANKNLYHLSTLLDKTNLTSYELSSGTPLLMQKLKRLDVSANLGVNG
jgi:uncharacterized protein (DUF58 family)